MGGGYFLLFLFALSFRLPGSHDPFAFFEKFNDHPRGNNHAEAADAKKLALVEKSYLARVVVDEAVDAPALKTATENPSHSFHGLHFRILYRKLEN